MADPIIVGATVLVNHKHRAVIRYIGETNFAPGSVWYGLELERPIGKHTGTVLGVRYFDAKEKRGTFVLRENLSPFDAAEEAAARIQANVRGMTAKKKVAKEVAWRAFNTLDANDEAQVLQRRARLMTSALGARLNRERPDDAALEVFEAEAAAMVIEEDYDGPVLEFPLTEDAVMSMMNGFRAGKPLHYKFAVGLMAQYRRFIGALPTLVYSEIAPGTRLTVCGDTHGQLQDLFSIFTINGIPSRSNRYLMNGDFVDRGEWACEILFTLMAFAMLHPGEYGTGRGAALMINRGNHESANQNLTGGFMIEVLDKYSPSGGSANPERGLRMYDMLQATFDSMPLAHVVSSGEKRVFVVHGGMMQKHGVRLEHVAAIQRKREIPFGFPGFEDKLFEDLMWSDPRPHNGHAPSDRGAGVFFGPDVTENFCALNNISLVVRSHECVPEGYQFMHDGRLLTIFSASRYCGRGTNRGAFIVFEADLTHTVQQFVAGDLESSAPARKPPPADTAAVLQQFELATPIAAGRLAELKRVGPGGLTPALGAESDDADEAAQAEAVRRMIVERICLHKADLFAHWAAVEKRSTGPRNGHISRMQWAEGMRVVLNLELPWISLADMLVDREPDGRINFSLFLDRYRIAMRDCDTAWMDGILERVCSRLFVACESLEDAFKAMDADGSGVVEYDELERGLMRLDLGLSRGQIVDLMSSIDTDRDGRISFAEFGSRFREAFSRVKSVEADEIMAGGGPLASPGPTGAGSLPGDLRPITPNVVMEPWAEAAIARIGEGLLAAKLGDNSAAIFTAIDTNADGLLSPAEFSAAVRKLNLGFSEVDIARVIAAVDANGSGNINYLEFTAAFRGVPQMEAPVNWRPHITDAAAAQLAAAVAAHGQLTISSSNGSGSCSAPSSAASGTPSGGGSRAPILAEGAKSFSVDGTGSRNSTNGPPGSPGGSTGSSRSWQRGVIERIVATLYEFRVELGAAFRMFDLDGDGVIDRNEFRQGLQALTSLNGSPITDMQADEMLKALDTDGSGSISYPEFVGGFKLIDTKAVKG